MLFNKNGWYAPLDKYDFSDYPTSAVELGMHNGKPHLVPVLIEWQVLYYRKDLLEKHGVKVPTTFEELEHAARTLHSPEVAGFAARGNGPAAVTQLSTYIYNFGGTYLQDGVAVFDSPQAIEAIRLYGRLLGSYGPQGVTAMSWEHLIPVFQAGRIAMYTDASSQCGQIMDPTKTQIPMENIGVVKLPAGPRGDSPFIVVAWAMAISSRTRDLDSSMKFLNWSTSKDMYTRGSECYPGPEFRVGRQDRHRRDEPRPYRDHAACFRERQSPGQALHDISCKSP
jgi:multiple sugar transport system substrate-binding protein